MEYQHRSLLPMNKVIRRVICAYISSGRRVRHFDMAVLLGISSETDRERYIDVSTKIEHFH